MSGARLDIRLKPRAKNDRIAVAAGDLVEVAVTSPPVDERANTHLIELLAKKLGVAKRSITVFRGGHSRNKVVAIAGMTKDEAIGRIQKGCCR